MDREINHNQENHQFELRSEGQLASLEYKMHRGSMYIMHTKVPETISGKGIGSALAEAVLTYAQEEQLPIRIYCPFVRKYVEEHPHYQELTKMQPNQQA